MVDFRQILVKYSTNRIADAIPFDDHGGWADFGAVRVEAIETL